MYEQQLYTRSNYGGIFENRPGFTTVGATSGLDTKDIEALEQHCEYPVSKKVLEKCGCQSMPYVRYFMKGANDTYIVGQSCFRKEEGISDREVFLVHNIAVKKNSREYEGFASNLYHLAGYVPFVTEFCDREPETAKRVKTAGDLFQTISDDTLNDESQFCFNEERLENVGISRGIFQMIVYAVISAIGTKKKVFINLNCDMEQVTKQAIMVMQHIYAVLPNVLRDRVGYQTFYSGEAVKSNIMIYFFPNGLIDAGKTVNQIGERNLKQDYLFCLSEPVGIQPADAFIEVQNRFGYIDLGGLYQIKQKIDTFGGWLIGKLKHITYERYCHLVGAQNDQELYERELDMCCAAAMHMEDLYALIQTVFHEMKHVFAEDSRWLASTKEMILKHTERIAEQCESVYSETLAFPTKEFKSSRDVAYKNSMENCLLKLLNTIQYDTDYIYPTSKLEKIVDSRYISKELKNEICVLQAVNEALRITEDKSICGDALCETLEMLPLKSEKKARIALEALAQNENSVKEDEKYIILMSINIRYGRLDFEKMFQSLDMEMMNISDFLEWYLCSERNVRRNQESERDALDHYMMNLCAKREEPEVLEEVLPIYKRYCKNNKSQKKNGKRVIHAIKIMQRTDIRKRIVDRFRR